MASSAARCQSFGGTVAYLSLFLRLCMLCLHTSACAGRMNTPLHAVHAHHSPTMSMLLLPLIALFHATYAILYTFFHDIFRIIGRLARVLLMPIPHVNPSKSTAPRP